MNRVSEYKERISQLNNLIEEIQDQCSHPEKAINKIAKSNTGNFDPSEDKYWYHCYCTLCEKSWNESQT